MPLLAKVKSDLIEQSKAVDQASEYVQQITGPQRFHLKVELIQASIAIDQATATGLMVDELRRANQLAEAACWAALGEHRLARECLAGR